VRSPRPDGLVSCALAGLVQDYADVDAATGSRREVLLGERGEAKA
jgi:hypothetical protein